MGNQCRRHIKSIEYFESGLVKRVEFFERAQPLTVYTLAKTIGEKTTVIRKNVSIKQILRPLP